ncbi:hypothetical protein DFH27DRAFT_561048, partial [Peziza echinospora]
MLEEGFFIGGWVFAFFFFLPFFSLSNSVNIDIFTVLLHACTYTFFLPDPRARSSPMATFLSSLFFFFLLIAI